MRKLALKILFGGSIILTLLSAGRSRAVLPSDYLGRPFEDADHKQGPAMIPGILQCAHFDLGGEGTAYHSNGTNHGSAELNRRPEHQRAHATPYIWSFRADEGVSLSYTKDMA